MKPVLLRTVAATLLTAVAMLAYGWFIYWRALQYVAHGWDMPLNFRIQVGISNLLIRFWWFLTPFFAVAWGIIFLIIHAIRGDRSQVASA